MLVEFTYDLQLSLLEQNSRPRRNEKKFYLKDTKLVPKDFLY